MNAFQFSRPTLVMVLLLAALLAQENCMAVQQEKAIGVRKALNKLPSDIAQVPDRHAIIIGAGEFASNKNTDRKDIPALPQCDTDAEILYGVLTDPGKGMFEKENVVLLTGSDATKDRIVEELDELSNRIDKEDLVVVYFSGHGATDSKGRAFWVTYDTEIERLFATGLRQLIITDLLNELVASRVVTIIDACYAASTANLTSSSKAPLINVKELYNDFSGKGRVIIAAADGSEQSLVINDADHPGNGQSVFSWHLSEGLSGAADANEDGVITVDEVWDHVKDRTSVTARKLRGKQTPTIKSDMVGRFLFSVNSEVLVGNYEKRVSRERQLRTFALDEQLTVEQYREASSLLGKDPSGLNRESKERREVYLQAADGELDVSRLTRALALVKPMVVAKPKPKPKPVAKPKPERAPQLVKNRPPVRKRADLGVTYINTLGMKLTGIPAGDFLMGSSESPEQVARAFIKETPGNFFNEHPLRRVRIGRSFFMGTTEVTVDQFRAFVNATGYRTQVEKGEMGSAATAVEFEKSANWQSPLGGQAAGQHPVAVITYNDAVAFCRWLSGKEGKTYRLPTDAEWEYAARAGTKTRYWNGNSVRRLCEIANIPDASRARALNHTFEPGEVGHSYSDGDDGFPGFAPVGSFRANPWGLHDVHGNVWEWCSVSDLSSLKIGNTNNTAVIRGGCFY